MMDTYRHILSTIIVGIIVLILILLLAAVTRRIRNAKKYAALDGYRDGYRKKVSQALQSGTLMSIADYLRARPSSLQWRAIEEVLFEHISDSRYEKEIARLFQVLGYRDYYEHRLKSKRVIIKAAAVDKLGKMLSEPSTASLVSILNTEKDPEILAVAVRALCRFSGCQEGLKGILERLPELYAKSLVSQKTIEASLINYSADAVPLLVACGRTVNDQRIKASLLEVLSHLPPTPVSLDFALANLKASDAEVRAKAIKVFGRDTASADMPHAEILLPLLGDPVWFVRLQASRALENLRCGRAVDNLGVLLLDSNWQVRNAAARALSHIGDASLDVFLNVLNHTDRYAKESICEEAERTRFTQRLIENLMSTDTKIRGKSREILRIMHSLNFSTLIHDYWKNGENGTIKQEISLLMQEATALRKSNVGGERPGSYVAQRSEKGWKI
jgi:HEAT repeat protein